jgi:hypothetical protein
MPARDQSPEDSVAARCHRLRTATTVDVLPVLIVTMMFGPLIWWATIFHLIERLVLLTMPPTPLGPAGAAPPPPVPAVARSVFNWLSNSDNIIGVVVLGLFLWLFPRLMRMYTDRILRRGYRSNAALRRTKSRRGLVVLWLWGSLLCVGLLATAVLTSSAIVALIPGGMFASKAGFALLAIAVTARRGKRVVCARCEYPMGSWRRAASNCSECGHAWKNRWGARFGVRALNFTALKWGLSLLLTSTVLVVASMYAMFPR